MTHRPQRRASAAAVGAALVGADIIVRALVGEPYLGATALLVAACGVSLISFLPYDLARVSLRIATVPALGIVSFSVLLTTISIAGIALTEVSIRIAVIALVGGLGLVAGRLDGAVVARVGIREGVALACLLGVVAFGLASAWDVVGPFPPPGVDWGHYLLYADEVEAQNALLIDDPYAGERGRLFADSPGVGALYGGVRILDGAPSSWLSYGIVVISALSALGVFAAAGALWGLGAGVLASAVWVVAPIRVDPIRWHGVGTCLALVFVPLVLLALGLLYRGARGWRVVGLLALSLLGVGVTHSTSAFIVAFLLAAVLVVDVLRAVARRRSVPEWWRRGIVRPLLGGVALAAAAGAGVVAHVQAQAADLGAPVDYRLFEPDWLSWHVVVDYYSLAFLALTAVSLTLVLSSRTLRRDSALLALLALAATCVVVGELWRVEVPFEYRRVVFYLGVAMALLVGAASVRLPRRAWWLACYAVSVAYLAHVSIGLGLPERLLAGRGDPKGQASQEIMEFRERLERGLLPEASLVVADECHNFVVPYLLRRPTLVAFQPWQVGFESRIPLAETASRILAGDRTGRRLAESLGVGYVLANPSCTPDLARRLGGKAVFSTDQLVVVDIRSG